MSLAARHPGWLAAVRAAADRAPLRPRVDLQWQGDTIGSVEPDFLAQVEGDLPRGTLSRDPRGWHVHGDLTASLAQVAHAMRARGLAHVWRDEQLAVTDAQRRVRGRIERAAVRPLGIRTFAVHLVGRTADGHHWVQQRALDKPTDPGRWDTLMGGMVPATDSLAQALARETWEEAGLRLDQLVALEPGGTLHNRWPREDGGGAGYLVEQVDWFRCVVPEGIVPINRDGEVAQFRCMAPDELESRLVRGEFTPEASLILAEAGL